MAALKNSFNYPLSEGEAPRLINTVFYCIGHRVVCHTLTSIAVYFTWGSTRDQLPTSTCLGRWCSAQSRWVTKAPPWRYITYGEFGLPSLLLVRNGPAMLTLRFKNAFLPLLSLLPGLLPSSWLVKSSPREWAASVGARISKCGASHPPPIFTSGCF